MNVDISRLEKIFQLTFTKSLHLNHFALYLEYTTQNIAC